LRKRFEKTVAQYWCTPGSGEDIKLEPGLAHPFRHLPAIEFYLVAGGDSL